MYEVLTPVLSPSTLAAELAEGRYEDLTAAFKGVRQAPTVHHINSTPAGGGVAEMLLPDIGYAKGLGADWRWQVIQAPPEYFVLTKHLHNALHGCPQGAAAVSASKRSIVAEVGRVNADTYAIRPGDIVILHDPQVIGLVEPLRQKGATVLWRSHIGVDTPNEHSAHAWAFLAPFLEQVDGVIFTRTEHVPAWIHRAGIPVYIMPPSIDPLSPKNEHRESYHLPLAPRPETRRTVVQVARWDRLKDPLGLIASFVEAAWDMADTDLYLVGPEVEGVTDDPEAVEVYRQVLSAIGHQRPKVRERIHAHALDMHDRTINAHMTARYQAGATVVAQNSRMEGFGLTVTEAMWKRKVVVANAVGGIGDQIVKGTGLLVHEPSVDNFARVLRAALVMSSDKTFEVIGDNAHRRVQNLYLSDTALLNYKRLIDAHA